MHGKAIQIKKAGNQQLLEFQGLSWFFTSSSHSGVLSLKNLDFTVVVSRESDKALVNQSIEAMTTETCLPVELMHGHVIDLVEKDVDYIFIPFIVNGKERPGNKTSNCNCPWIQTYPFMVKAALKVKG